MSETIVNTIPYIGGGTSVYDKIYPVGSVYISTSNTSPASIFGGSWEQLSEIKSDPDYTNGNYINNYDSGAEGQSVTISQDCVAAIWFYNTGADSQRITLLLNGRNLTDAYGPGLNINSTWYTWFGGNLYIPLNKGDVLSVSGTSNQRLKIEVNEFSYKTVLYRWRRTA